MATKSTVLLYTEKGMFDQIKNIPNVKNPEKNWLAIDPGYNTNGQMLLVHEALEDIFKSINAGKPFEKEYVWEYNTPQLQGLYLVVYDRNKSIVPQLESDLSKEVQALCEEFGFIITSTKVNPDAGHYLQVNTDKK